MAVLPCLALGVPVVQKCHDASCQTPSQLVPIGTGGQPFALGGVIDKADFHQDGGDAGIANYVEGGGLHPAAYRTGLAHHGLQGFEGELFENLRLAWASRSRMSRWATLRASWVRRCPREPPPFSKMALDKSR